LAISFINTESGANSELRPVATIRGSPTRISTVTQKKQKTSIYDVAGFGEFRMRATDPALSQYEKVGFPDEYRAGRAPQIIADIGEKLTNLNARNRSVLDIGPGCTDLPATLIQHCQAQGHDIVLVDSPEMLSLLPDLPNAVKIAGRFPDCIAQVEAVHTRYDAILIYSVIQYVFSEGNLWPFLDRAAALLANGGQMLIGDIPNASRRRRFLASPAGQAYHRRHFGSAPIPEAELDRLEAKSINDSVVLAIVTRMRAAGHDAYIVPQAPELPMANRREDILICKP
jgi:cyclopropane fatty-acyl-phospholipid synthase-like methyltransferase